MRPRCVLTDLAAIATVGLLLSATILAPSGKDGTLSRTGRRDAVRAVWAAGVWALLAAVQLFFLLALVLGVSLMDAFTPAVVSTYANEIDSTRALLVMSILALVVAVGAVTPATTGASGSWLAVAVAAAALPGLAGHSSSLGDHELAITANVTHMVSAVLWVGGTACADCARLQAGPSYGARRPTFSQRSPSRHSSFSSRPAIWRTPTPRLDGLDQFFSTGYGT